MPFEELSGTINSRLNPADGATEPAPLFQGIPTLDERLAAAEAGTQLGTSVNNTFNSVGVNSLVKSGGLSEVNGGSLIKNTSGITDQQAAAAYQAFSMTPEYKAAVSQANLSGDTTALDAFHAEAGFNPDGSVIPGVKLGSLGGNVNTGAEPTFLQKWVTGSFDAKTRVTTPGLIAPIVKGFTAVGNLLVARKQLKQADRAQKFDEATTLANLEANKITAVDKIFKSAKGAASLKGKSEANANQIAEAAVTKSGVKDVNIKV